MVKLHNQHTDSTMKIWNLNLNHGILYCACQGAGKGGERCGMANMGALAIEADNGGGSWNITCLKFNYQ